MYTQEKQNLKQDIVRKAEMVDAPIILDILRKNLAKNLSEEEKKQGFLFYEPTNDEIEKIINDTGIYLSFRGNELKGYLMTMSRELAKSIPFEAELVVNAENLIYENKKLVEYSYAVLAQICITKEFRGGTTFNELHLVTKNMLKKQGYELGVAEIADTNIKSLCVHKKLTDIGTYIASTGLKWHIFVSDLRKD